ncbi:hypothetical protein GWI33_009205 [Rhynchophorus ferrugineus]|uniref:receptor protein-tyrosine kinase n=1 Tax=Rhynchophorus ferrugineus TaxID=354439 RepID=A0A834IAW6_RHYFE|nr:hypothetical protein GWI33_009205 [Rhynchophorus ferrugineus]
MYVIHIVCVFLSIVVSVVKSEDYTTSICLDCFLNSENRRCHAPLCRGHGNNCSKSYNLDLATDSSLQPLLLCREETSLVIQWMQNNDPYIIRYSKLGSSKYRITSLSSCNYKTLTGLTPGTSYVVEVFSFLDQQRLYKSHSIIAETRTHLAIRRPVEKLRYTLVFHNDFYLANLQWTQGQDLSCLYKVIWHKKGNSLMHRKFNIQNVNITQEKDRMLLFSISPLEMGSKYNVEVSSENEKGTRESPIKVLQISVPSCLATYKNFSICPPDMPENLTAVKYFTDDNPGMTYKLQLYWNKPIFFPDFYNATLVSNSSLVSQILPGNSTEVAFQILTADLSYYVRLTACSLTGTKSNPAFVRISDSKRVIQSNRTTYSEIWIWVVTIIFIFAIILSCWLFGNKITDAFKKRLEKLDEIGVKFARDNFDREIDESKLLMDKIIGVGAFGVVQRAYCYTSGHNKVVVAAKMLKEQPTEEQLRQFYAEIEIMRSVPKHPHIIHLIGVVTKSRPNNPLLLVEYCSNGDLHTFLKKVWLVLENKENHRLKARESGLASKVTVQKGDENTLRWKDLLSFARQISIGMEFLSSLKMIHRDLAARNILVTEHHTLKISDFGLSRDIYVNNMYKKVTGGKLPFRWMALESLTHQIYTTESDVWSFGIVLWEIVTLGANPYPTLDAEDLIPLLKNGYRMEKPANCPDEIYCLMKQCWNSCPNLRPTFTDLRKAFDNLLEVEASYVNLMTDLTIRYENSIIHSKPDDFDRYLTQEDLRSDSN